MKRIIATAALALVAVTGTAQATSVSATDLHSLRGYVSQADIEGLTPAQVRVIVNMIHSGDKEGEKRQKVRAYLQ